MPVVIAAFGVADASVSLLLLLLLICQLVFTTCATHLFASYPISLSLSLLLGPFLLLGHVFVALCRNSSREKLLEIKLPSNDLSPWAGTHRHTPFHLKDRISFFKNGIIVSILHGHNKDGFVFTLPTQKREKKGYNTINTAKAITHCQTMKMCARFFLVLSFPFVSYTAICSFIRCQLQTIQSEMNNAEWHQNNDKTLN